MFNGIFVEDTTFPKKYILRVLVLKCFFVFALWFKKCWTILLSHEKDILGEANQRYFEPNTSAGWSNNCRFEVFNFPTNKLMFWFYTCEHWHTKCLWCVSVCYRLNCLFRARSEQLSKQLPDLFEHLLHSILKKCSLPSIKPFIVDFLVIPSVTLIFGHL